MAIASFPERPAELRAVLEGRLTGNTVQDWRDGLIALAARRPRLLTLDLRNVTFLDASVIVTLRALERRLVSAGGRVALLAPSSLSSTLRRMGMAHLLAEPGRASGNPA